MERTTHFALVGPGRAGTAIAEALTRAGWSSLAVAGRSLDSPSVVRFAERFACDARPVGEVARDADLVLLATPDDAVGPTATALAGSLRPGALVVHLAGSLDLTVFDGLLATAPDALVAGAHPLQTLPGLPDDADRLQGAWFAVDGDPLVTLMVEAVGGRSFTVTDRVRYHAAACVASNHFVGLMGQVERLTAGAGVPFEALAPLIRATAANVAEQGPAAALSGPIARGDAATVERHLAALDPAERPTYRALAREALALTGRDDPVLAALLADPDHEEALR